MGILPLIVIAVGLAMDATAVSLGAGASGRRRAAFRLAFHFGLFQALMPLLGWLAGRGLADLLQAVDHWIAFALLAAVGGRMVWGGCHPEPAAAAEARRRDPSRGWALVALSIATSIDAFAVGLGLAMLDVAIWVPVALIGVITAAMSVSGLLLGRVLSAAWGSRAEILGGLLLLGIGVQILVGDLVEHGRAAAAVTGV
ncbi:MAG: manganese efflux pump [Krumholzibacteria bacterium]|nr:manganese efflux pump [Candidatus Krumholzibacteria bacterium]